MGHQGHSGPEQGSTASRQNIALFTWKVLTLDAWGIGHIWTLLIRQFSPLQRDAGSAGKGRPGSSIQLAFCLVTAFSLLSNKALTERVS